MSKPRRCDYCGKAIRSEQAYGKLTMTTVGEAPASGARWGSRHFHTSGDYWDDCLRHILNGVDCEISAAEERRAVAEGLRDASDRARRGWTEMPHVDREQLLMAILDREGEIGGWEIETILREEHDCCAWRREVNAVLGAMFRRGDITRRQDPSSGRRRWVWSRKAELSGLIAGLERALSNSSEAA